MGKIVEFKKPKHTLEELRVRKNLSLSSCAKAIGVHPLTLRRWEQGKSCPSLDQGVRLCFLLGVRLDCVSWAEK